MTEFKKTLNTFVVCLGLSMLFFASTSTLAAGKGSKSKGGGKAQSWYLKTNVYVEDGAFFAYDDRSGVIGRIDDGQQGRDRHDIPVFQGVNGARAAVVFIQDEASFGESAGQYLSDYRPSGNNKQVWTFTVTTSRPNADVTLYWDGLMKFSKRPDGGYAEVLDNSDKLLRNLRLVDLELGEEVTLAVNKNGVPNFYKFNMNGQTQRQFRWVQGGVDDEDLMASATQRLAPVSSGLQSLDASRSSSSRPPALPPVNSTAPRSPVDRYETEK